MQPTPSWDHGLSSLATPANGRSAATNIADKFVQFLAGAGLGTGMALRSHSSLLRRRAPGGQRRGGTRAGAEAGWGWGWGSRQSTHGSTRQQLQMPRAGSSPASPARQQRHYLTSTHPPACLPALAAMPPPPPTRCRHVCAPQRRQGCVAHAHLLSH